VDVLIRRIEWLARTEYGSSISLDLREPNSCRVGARHAHGQERTALYNHNSGPVPIPAQSDFRYGQHSGVLSARKLIEKRRQEPVTAGERHIAVIKQEVAHAAGVAAGFRGESRWIETLCVCEIPRICVSCEELQSPENRLFKETVRVMVVLNTAAAFGLHFAEQRIFQQRRGVVESHGIGRKLPQVDLHAHVAAVVAVIGDPQAGVESQVPLDRQVPLLNYGFRVMEIAACWKNWLFAVTARFEG